MNVLIDKWLLPTAGLPANFTSNIALYCADLLHTAPQEIEDAQIISCSIDSRSSSPKLLLTVLVRVSGKFSGRNGRILSDEEVAALAAPALHFNEKTTLKHPLVIGTGPAGISAALALAMAGCEPVIIDRGAPVMQRIEDYRTFLQTRELDEESNLLIGEGGAGTFSDGKLYTGTKDINARFLKDIYVRCGAPQEILWRSRPHIGSDYLPQVAQNMREMIISLGGKFIFNTHITSLLVRSGRCCGAVSSSGEKFVAPAVILAPGLGGRELIRSVCSAAAWEFKKFQTGCRIEHPQHFIDRAMYHTKNRPAVLGAAEYHIVSRGNIPVSSFCMCPGGTLVNATGKAKRSISNGMSRFARDGKYANSCLIATFEPADFGSAEEFFKRFDTLESDIFEYGGKDYTFPAQDAYAFCRRSAGLVSQQTGCDTGIIPGRLDELIPQPVHTALSEALIAFDRKIPGFIKNGKLVGAESFVSSPLRILRDRETYVNPALPGLYPAGEGCGLAGGIISAGCDGIRAALALMEAF